MATYKIVDADTLDANLASIASALKTKLGTSGNLTFPDDFITAINSIDNGGDSSLSDSTITFAYGTSDAQEYTQLQLIAPLMEAPAEIFPIHISAGKFDAATDIDILL